MPWQLYAGAAKGQSRMTPAGVKPYYEHKGIAIIHGDCREILPTLPNVDLIVTDPPYGIGEAAGKNKSRTKLAAAKDYGVSDWDDKTPEQWIFGLIRAKSTHQIIFGGNYFPLPPSRCWLIWDKVNGANDFADCELAWTNLDKAVRKFEWMWNGMIQQDMRNKEFRPHPTQKPVAVMKWVITQAPETCKSLIDPYMGTGTTLVAAKHFGLSAIGIEREEKYCEIAVNRLRQQVLDLGEAA